LFSELSGKGSKVRYACTWQQDIANKSFDIFWNTCNGFLPSDSFIFEKNNKLLCSYLSLRGSIHFKYKFFFLILHLFTLCFKLKYLFLQTGNSVELTLKLSLCFLKNVNDFTMFRFLGLNFLGDKLILRACNTPDAKSCCSLRDLFDLRWLKLWLWNISISCFFPYLFICLLDIICQKSIHEFSYITKLISDIWPFSRFFQQDHDTLQNEKHTFRRFCKCLNLYNCVFIKLFDCILSSLKFWFGSFKISLSIICNGLSLTRFLVDNICLGWNNFLHLIRKLFIFVYLPYSSSKLFILFFQFWLHFFNTSLQDCDFGIGIIQLFETFCKSALVALELASLLL